MRGTNVYTVLKTKEGNLKDFCFCDITQYGALMVTKSFESPSVLLDYFYAERDSLSRIKQKANDLFKLLINTSERTQRRVQNQREELKECKDREKYRIYGDLITSNLYALQKGMDYVNSHTAEEIAKTIQPQFAETPLENITKIVKRYQEQDTWKENLVFEKSSFELLENILEEAGELPERVPYEDLVNTEFAKAAAEK